MCCVLCNAFVCYLLKILFCASSTTQHTTHMKIKDRYKHTWACTENLRFDKILYFSNFDKNDQYKDLSRYEIVIYIFFKIDL